MRRQRNRLARLYANENVARRIVEHLRGAGHDVVTSFEAGRANQEIEDIEVLSDAFQDQRVVLTNNRVDFRKLHASNQEHCGIVEYTLDLDFAALAARIHSAVSDPRAVGRFYASVTKEQHVFR